MKQLDIKDAILHDATINDINYNGETLTLCISDAFVSDVRCNFDVKIKLETYDFSIYRLRRYPAFRNVRIKGKEISVNELKLFFKKEHSLQIVEFCASIDSTLTLIECEILPYTKQRGASDTVVFRLNCDYDKLVLIKT